MPRGKTEKTKERERLIYAWAEEHNPVTVRQLFYRLSTLDAVPKNEAGYKSVGTICTKMRRAGDLPYNWIADNTRWQRKPRTYHSLQDALNTTARTYRRSLWDTQKGLVEIWCEKEALAGVLLQVTERWDVPLMVVRGYPSLSFMHSAAENINYSTYMDKQSFIFYFGDHDPSGKDIFRHIAHTLREFAPDANIEIEQIAVTEQQIAEMDLPSRPTKRTDSRAKGFIGDSVELDAIPPDKLRQLVEDCIESIVNKGELHRILEIENAEKESIFEFISTFEENPNPNGKKGVAPF